MMSKLGELDKTILHYLRKIFPKTRVVRVWTGPGDTEVTFCIHVQNKVRECRIARDVLEAALMRNNDAYIRDTVLNMLEITLADFEILKSWQTQAPIEYYKHKKAVAAERARQLRRKYDDSFKKR